MDLTGVAIFLVDFLKCWKDPSNSSETFKMLFFHQNNQFEAKTACFAEFPISPKSLYPDLTGVAFFWLIFRNVENTLQFFWNIQNVVLSSKQSVEAKQHVLQTFQFWPKSLDPDITGVANLLVDFFWLSFSNVENTLRILLKHSKFCSSSKQSVWRKNRMFADFSILTKVAVSVPYQRGHFILLVDFFSWVFQMLKIPFEFFWNIQNLCSFIKTNSLKQKQHVLRTFQFWPKSLYPDITGVAILLVDFFGRFLKCWKYSSNSSETFKILFLHQNNQFEAKTACFTGFSISTKIAVSGPYRRWPFCWLIFWVEFFKCWKYLRILSETFKMLFFHQNKQLKQKQHVLRTFQFWPKSLYPDITGVAILLVNFFGWVFQMLKILFKFFWNIQNFVLSSKQSVWSKNSMFCGLFNFH